MTMDVQQAYELLVKNPKLVEQIKVTTAKVQGNDETTEIWRQALKRFQEENGPQGTKEQNKMAEDIMQELDARWEHFEKHNVFLDKKEYEKAMDEFVKAGGTKKEFKADNSLVKNKKVKAYIEQNFMKDGVIDQRALKDFVLGRTAGDLELNYGIHRKHNGDIGQDEYRQMNAITGLTDKQNAALVRDTGALAEKSDKGKKVALAALKGAGIGAGVGAAVGSVAGAALNAAATGVKATAEAKAAVVDLVSGQVIKGASDAAAATLMDAITKATGLTSLVLPGGLIGAAIGAPLGAAIGAGIKAMTYHYDGKHDLMNGHEIADVVKDPSLMTKDLKGDLLECAQTAEFLINLVKKAGVPDEKIVAAIKEAGVPKDGDNHYGRNINCHEFAAAMKLLFEDESQVPEPPKTPEQKQPVKQVEEQPVKQVEEQPVKPQVKEPPAEEPAKPEDFTVIVQEGESLNRLAKKYGVTVQELKDLNKDVLRRFKKRDCSDYIYGFRAGATIKLPPTANKDAVEENNANVNAKDEQIKYGKRVWSDEYINYYVEQYKKDGKACEKAIKEAGGQALLDEVIKRIAAQNDPDKAAQASGSGAAAQAEGQKEGPKMSDKADWVEIIGVPTGPWTSKPIGIPRTTPMPTEQEAIENLKNELDKMGVPHETEDYGELYKLYDEAIRQKEIDAEKEAVGQRARAGRPEFLVPPEDDPDAKTFAPGPGMKEPVEETKPAEGAKTEKTEDVPQPQDKNQKEIDNLVEQRDRLQEGIKRARAEKNEQLAAFYEASLNKVNIQLTDLGYFKSV